MASAGARMRRTYARSMTDEDHGSSSEGFGGSLAGGCFFGWSGVGTGARSGRNTQSPSSSARTAPSISPRLQSINQSINQSIKVTARKGSEKAHRSREAVKAGARRPSACGNAAERAEIGRRLPQFTRPELLSLDRNCSCYYCPPLRRGINSVLKNTG